MSGLAALPRVGRGLAVVSAVALWATHGALGADLTATLAAAAILLAGLPHGGLDRLLTLGRFEFSPAGAARTAAFTLGYLTVAGSTVAFWLASPTLGLSAFLAVSLIHFGLGDRTAGPRWFRGLQVLAHGGAPIVLIPALHPDAVAVLFTHLSDADAAALILQALRALLPIWAAVALGYAATAIGRHGGFGRVVELALLAAVFAFLPPLLGFLVYFGAVHGPRHLGAALDAVRARGLQERAVAVEVAGLSAIAAAGIAVAVTALAGASIDQESVVRGMFVGLAALTVPHMLLVDVVGRRLRDRARTPA